MTGKSSVDAPAWFVTRWIDFESWTDAYELNDPDQRMRSDVSEPFASALDAMEFDGARCLTCGGVVGGYLGVDPNTDTDVSRWNWVTVCTNADGTKTWLLCEGCSVALSGPVGR